MKNIKFDTGEIVKVVQDNEDFLVIKDKTGKEIVLRKSLPLTNYTKINTKKD